MREGLKWPIKNKEIGKILIPSMRLVATEEVRHWSMTEEMETIVIIQQFWKWLPELDDTAQHLWKQIRTDIALLNWIYKSDVIN